jgi:cellulose 1,4-beta-cellobiosidase
MTNTTSSPPRRLHPRRPGTTWVRPGLLAWVVSLAACSGPSTGGPAAAPGSTSASGLSANDPDEIGSLPPAAAAAAGSAPSAVTAPSEAQNPFVGARFYIDPEYVEKVEGTVRGSPSDAPLLKKLEAFPTAVWLDSIQTAGTVSRKLDEALAQEKKAHQPVVTVFALYDLPDRDCAAVASNGELASEHGGEMRYQKDFIDKIAAQFRAHSSQRIVAVVEPDSLANIATNLSLPRCAKADAVYRRSTAYAVKALSMPNVSLYLDAAHAGWLGWMGNRSKIATIFSEVLADAGGPDKIRGFVTNVSNYDALQDGDLQKLEPSSPANGELPYIGLLDASLSSVGIRGKAFLVDTSRNGRAGIRSKPGSWCNVRGAGLGERPRATPAPLVDAYLWMKPPGESDGGADPSKAGFDRNCGPDAPDAAPNAPRAGAWFASYLVDLARNANPPL